MDRDCLHKYRHRQTLHVLRDVNYPYHVTLITSSFHPQEVLEKIEKGMAQYPQLALPNDLTEGTWSHYGLLQIKFHCLS